MKIVAFHTKQQHMLDPEHEAVLSAVASHELSNWESMVGTGLCHHSVQTTPEAHRPIQCSVHTTSRANRLPTQWVLGLKRHSAKLTIYILYC